ncbi:uncharacterized protein LOC106536875 [Austrofundulus limnaeus]|uniref:Uncharacterized protein LOC106536875 n=1 Tax=Austrofundulus limnaeus TaxID=52670 RepID=A0A2I4DBQ6_AUSLI|nr:PREDICTED: uncharacterized protein LOC106536875 [Austrofundulus limnaeus]
MSNLSNNTEINYFHELEQALQNLIQQNSPSTSESNDISVLSQSLQNVLNSTEQNSPPGSPENVEPLMQALYDEIARQLSDQDRFDSFQIHSTNLDHTPIGLLVNALNNSLSELRNTTASDVAAAAVDDDENSQNNTPDAWQSTHSDLFSILDDALLALRTARSPEQDPISSPETDSLNPAPCSCSAIQHGAGVSAHSPPSSSSSSPNPRPSHVPSPPPSSPEPSNGPDQNEISRERFNNYEITRQLFIPQSDDPPNLADFYTQVMNILSELADRTASLTERGDFIQLELSGHGSAHHIAFALGGEDESEISEHFTDFLDELIQSNAEIEADGTLEFTVQIVRNQRGGSKRKLSRTLDVELLHKKRQRLYFIQNQENNICFSLSLAHVCNPTFTDAQALQTALQWQTQLGFSVQTPVSLSDVIKFEHLIERKIVFLQTFPRRSAD